MRLTEDRDRRQRAIFNFIILFVSLVGVAKRNYVLDQSSLFDNFLIDSFAPLQSSVTSVRSEVRNFFDHYIANINASKNNIELHRKINGLENKIFEFKEVSRENKRLKKLLDFGDGITYRKVLAQVVAWDSNSDFKVIRVNKGFKDGVQLQAAVVTSEGLVGYIYRLTDHFSDILTVLDSNNRVDGLVQRVRSHGIIEGYNNEKSIMKYISRAEPIILGDMVITSGLGNIYPKGVKVGTVSRIERESYGITQNVEISPAVDFGRLEEVVILLSNGDDQKRREWEALDFMDEETDNKEKK